MSTTKNLANQVHQAFDSARAGDFGPSAALVEFGAEIVPLLEPYLSDPNEDLRRQAVALLAQGGDDALPMFATALGDASPDIRQQSATALYRRFDPAAIAALPQLGAALRQSVSGGDHPAASILLLGYFSDSETRQALARLRKDRADELTELEAWNPVVPVAVAADVSLSRLGDGDARRRLLERIDAKPLNEMIFLLQVMREIDSPELLHALKNTALDDEREIQGDLPSGATPRPRLCDFAVNALVERLHLKVNFELSGHKRYREADMEAVRAGVDASIPR